MLTTPCQSSNGDHLPRMAKSEGPPRGQGLPGPLLSTLLTMNISPFSFFPLFVTTLLPLPFPDSPLPFFSFTLLCLFPAPGNSTTRFQVGTQGALQPLS